MTDIPTIQFEAKKHAWRQTQDGVVVSFVVHPNELHAGFAVAPLGTRYQVVVVQLGDDDRPVPPGVGPTVAPSQKGHEGPSRATVEGKPAPAGPLTTPGETRKEYTLANRVGMTCAEPKFQEWLSRRYPGTTVNKDTVGPLVRHICGVETRADILPGTPAATKWHALALEYEQATGRLAEERP